VLDAKGAAIAELIVGHKRVNPDSAAGGQQVYVRRPSENQSWLADGAIDISTDPSNWMGNDLTNIDRAKIASVEVTHPTSTLSFTGKDGKLALTAPADHPPLDQSKLDDVARALEFLSDSDVLPAAQQPGTPVGNSVFKTTDGLTITAKVTLKDKDPWVVLSAAGEGAAAEQAAKYGKIFDGWAYEVGSWKLAALSPTLDDLKAAPPPAPATAPPPATPAPPAAVPPPAPPPTAAVAPAKPAAPKKP
jgi:hypothetical protein